MQRLAPASRILLGLVFVVFSFDGVVHVIPLPTLPEPALAYLAMLMDMRLFYGVKALELVCGLLLLHGRFTTLGAVLLAPIIVNIVWFDAALDPASLPVALGLTAMEAVLLWEARAQLRPLLAPHPTASWAPTHDA